MDLLTHLQDAVCAELVATGDFEFVPGTGRVRVVQFRVSGTHEGSIDDPFSEVIRWELRPNLKGSRTGVLLHIFDAQDECVLIAEIVAQGMFRGRDRRTRGHALLRPVSDPARKRWKKFLSVDGWMQDVVVDEDDPGFRYGQMLPPQFDWTPYEWNLRESLGAGWKDLPESTTGVALIGYDRPEYMQKVVQSLAVNPEITDLPVFAFLDMPQKERLHVVDEQAQIIRKFIPHAVVIRRPVNFGCGRNIIDARRQLFDHMEYDRVFVFEDDMAVSPTYIGLVTRLMDWAENTYSNVGAVQGWSKCLRPLDWKLANLNRVRATYTNWWGYLQSRRSWDAISPMMYRYERLFLGGEYKYRPARSVIDWFRRSIKDGCEDLGGNTVAPDAAMKRQLAGYLNGPPSGQDAATMYSFMRAGFQRLMTVVNRGEYLGEHGIHMHPKMFRAHRFDQMTHDVFESDVALSDFALGETDESADVGVGEFVHV